MFYLTPSRNPRAGFTLIEVLISFLILGMVIAGLIYGYVQMNRTATWASWSLAAQSVASQGMEQARGAQWNELGGVDQWPPTTNAAGNITPYQNTNCTLDVPSTGASIYVTNYITIWNVSVAPPLRMIRSDCVWYFPLSSQQGTNTVITLRAPDQ
jgi:prepilin-type N-terminal cleavage/methylation domain-containing protein